MKLTLLAIGKAHPAELKAAIDKFTGRLGGYVRAEWLIVPAAKDKDPAAALRAEAKAILAQCKPDSFVVLLDEVGKKLTSPGLAKIMSDTADSGTKEIIWIIGGAYGVTETVRQRANLVWSLSPLTFPHQLVRLILAEQLYRAECILHNHPYHHASTGT